MAYQVFRYNPTDEHHEHAVGTVAYPRGPITDEWLEATARSLEHTDNPKSVDDLMSEIVSFKRADGKPLYSLSSKAKREGSEVTPLEQPTLSVQEAELQRLAAQREKAAAAEEPPAAPESAKAGGSTTAAVTEPHKAATDEPGATGAGSKVTQRPS